MNDGRTRSRFQLYKRRILIVAFLASAAAGPLAVVFPERSVQSRVVDIGFVIGFGILTLGWCSYDSLDRRGRLGPGSRVLIVIFGVIGLFIYLLKSRGSRRGLISVGIAILVCAGMLLIMTLSGVVAEAIFGVV
jgi:hypothetical protein